MRLSIIIPTYNCSEFLEETFSSVLTQLPDDCELVAVDDGSTDGTRRILESYAGKQKNVRIFFAEHGGASAARNRGLQEAAGDFVTFVDCDDCLRQNFLMLSLPLLEEGADLYIFGIERIPLEGNREYWKVKDRSYPDVSAFADEYIRVRQLMIYSNCNKFYRRSIIEKLSLKFDETCSFGEDRLFNYGYLYGCGSVRTSSLIELCYIQRSRKSLSTKHVPQMFRTAMALHDAKMKCFLSLSKGTTEKERLDFLAYDLSKETEMTIERFKEHPEEIEENLPEINKLVFAGADEPELPVDILLVLGSRKCDYRIRKAIEIGRRNPGVRYIVSGGNLYRSGQCTEAEYMYACLREAGVPESDIYLERRAKYTRQNISLSAGIIHELRTADRANGTERTVRRVGIVTGGFHIPRTRLIAERSEGLSGEEVCFFAAYGPATHPDSWYRDGEGRDILLEELRKTVIFRGFSHE